MIILDNGSLRVEIAERGAEIRRVTLNGEDRFWCGDPNVWGGVAPVLFPICGGLKEDRFSIGGEIYNLQKHGFAKNMDFEVEKQTNVSAVFLLTETPETLAVYPWKFELRIKYTLTGTAIRVDYDIKNNSESTMYTAIGSHEAYACPGGIEDYDIIFERKETLKSAIVNGKLIERNTNTVLFESNTLPLYNEYFTVDALVLTDLKSRFVTLRNRKNGKSAAVSFDGFDYLLIWTKPEAEYVCIEPWTSIPSYVDDEIDITLKEGMTAVLPKAHFEKTHIIYL